MWPNALCAVVIAFGSSSASTRLVGVPDVLQFLFIDPAGQADAIEALLLERHQLPGEPIRVPIIADDVVVSGDVEDAATERT